jgi:hypothetical protein
MRKPVMPLSEVLAGAGTRRTERNEPRKPVLAGTNSKAASGRYSALFDALNDDITNRQKQS